MLAPRWVVGTGVSEDVRAVADAAGGRAGGSCGGADVIDATVEQARILGVTLPDPDLKWNEERQAHDIGVIDWSEFWRVIAGDGPCNRERLQARVDAWDDGAWVREAALAHAHKQQLKEAA